jgi:NAD(P)-dependent dehydrogenase (short-subunit alcohol dehydrogenase family)
MERLKRERHSGVMHGKVCLITGATSGIGKATGLADMGASFVWTECFVSEDKAAKAGYVEPGTAIELHDARWDLRGRDDEPERKDG